MEEKTLFGMSIGEVNRQLEWKKGHDVDPQAKYGPINPQYGKSGGLLDPVLEGGEKILKEPETRKMVHDLLIRS